MTTQSASAAQVDPTATGLMSFAHTLADCSAATTLAYFRKPLQVTNKAAGTAFDPVTAADREAESAIGELICQHYPAHGLIGEEHGQKNAGAELTWVVDPIDGTRAFIMGTPLWGTLIGLLQGGQPLLGLMDQPFTRERFWADPKGAFWSVAKAPPQPLMTRPCAGLADAVLSTTHPDLFDADYEMGAFQRLKAQVRMTRFGGDCYAYCMLAAGHVDLVVEAGLKPFDIVALIPIIERAGGRVTTWDGKPATSGGRIVAAGDPRLHAAALRLLNC